MKTTIRKSASLAGVFFAVLIGGLLIPNTAQAAQMSPQMNVCHTVTVPPKLQWYQCAPFFSTPKPAGCYSTTKVVCSR